MLKRVVFIFLIIVLAVVAAAEIVLPSIVSRGVQNALASSGFGTAEQFQVRLRSFPSVRMLLGRFDQVSVISTNVATSNLILDELVVTLEDAAIDMKALLADKTLKVDRSGGGGVTITITAGSLKTYLAENVQNLREPAVTITADAATISGLVTTAGLDVAVALSGKFALAGPTKVGFTITACRVNDVAVPGDFLETWLTVLLQPDLSLDLSRFPLPVTAQEVVQEDGRLIIRGVTGQPGG